jgi:hypothetical protein
MRGGIVTVRLTSRWPYNPLSLAIGIAAGSRQFSHAITIIDDRGIRGVDDARLPRRHRR